MNQRRLMDRKWEPWLRVRHEPVPPSGWLRAVRSSLGMSARQLADRLGVKHSAIAQLEKREPLGKVSLETLDKAARAMNCKLVYAVVPNEPLSSLEEIVDDQAKRAAQAIVMNVDHTMRLEQQGLDPERLKERVQELAAELKSAKNAKFWDHPVLGRRKT